MKNLLIAVVAVALFACASQAQAAEPQSGEVSAAQLAELGLGGMQTLSDDQGQAIRGKFIIGPQTALGILINAQNQGAGPNALVQLLGIMMSANDVARATFPNVIINTNVQPGFVSGFLSP